MKKILITGGCGFIGSNLTLFLKKKNFNVFSLDNLFRKGSFLNLKRLKKEKITNFKINICSQLAIQKLPKFDLIIDCCAEPAVEASRKSTITARRVYKTNLEGTFNIIQKALVDKSKLIFLSTSRVYSIRALRNLISNNKYLNKKIRKNRTINEKFNTAEVKSLYGFTKLASEELIKEYNYSHGLKYIINRCGLVSGPWQFGKVDQGLVSLWSWKYLNKGNLSYTGFGGRGNQVRDILHIDDLCEIILLQIKKFNSINNLTLNISGGLKNSVSLNDLSKIYEKISGNTINHKKIKKTSIYDIPYYIGSNLLVHKKYDWRPKKSIWQTAKDVYLWQLNNKKKLESFLNEK